MLKRKERDFKNRDEKKAAWREKARVFLAVAHQLILSAALRVTSLSTWCYLLRPLFRNLDFFPYSPKEKGNPITWQSRCSPAGPRLPVHVYYSSFPSKIQYTSCLFWIWTPMGLSHSASSSHPGVCLSPSLTTWIPPTLPPRLRMGPPAWDLSCPGPSQSKAWNTICFTRLGGKMAKTLSCDVSHIVVTPSFLGVTLEY